MSEQQNVEGVKQIYAAYGQWDIPAILNAMTDDVEHHEPPAGPPPYRGTYRRREEVRAFFQNAADAVEVERFESGEFVAQGDTVVVLGDSCFRAKATHRAYETHWAMCGASRTAKSSNGELTRIPPPKPLRYKTDKRMEIAAEQL